MLEETLYNSPFVPSRSESCLLPHHNAPPVGYEGISTLQHRNSVSTAKSPGSAPLPSVLNAGPQRTSDRVDRLALLLLSLEEQDSAVAEIEVDEVLSFWPHSMSISKCPLNTMRRSCKLPAAMNALTVRHKTAKVTTNDAVPGRSLAFVELCYIA